MAKTTQMAFSIDTSGFTKGLREASNSLKVAKATFEANTAGMTSWSKSADGVREKLKLLASQQESYTKKTELLRNQISSINEVYQANAKKADELRAKKAELEKAGDTESESYKKVCKELKTTESQMQSQQKTIEKHETTLQMEELALTRVSNESGKWQSELQNLESQIIDTSAQTQAFASETEASEGRVSTSYSTVADSAVSYMKGAVVGAINAGIDAMKNFVVQSVEVGKTFDASMANVGAISGASADDMKKLEKTARDMASKTAFSATEMADALGFMAMAGWKTEDMIHGLDGVTYLAAASGEELAKTSDILTDGLTAFGLKAKDGAHFADVLAATSSNANTNVSMMGESFKYCGALAGSMGYNIEDTSLALGLMANAGVKGSQAGTALRGALGNLAKPSESVHQAMKALGISLTDASGDMYTLDELMQNIRYAFGGLTEDEKAYYATAMFGKNAMAGMLSIVGASEEDYKKLSKSISNCTGSAEKMSNTMIDNLAGDLDIAGSTAEELQLSISDKLEPTLRDLTQKGTEWIKNLTTWFKGLTDSDWNKIISGIESITIALSGFAIASLIVKCVDAFKKLKAATEGMTIAQAMLNAVQNANPIMLIVTAIGALIAGILYLWNTNEDFRNFIIGCWKAISAVFGDFIAWCQTLPSKIGEIWTSITEFFGGIFTAVGNFFTGIWTTITTFFTNIWTKLTEFWTTLTTLFEQYKENPAKFIGEMLGMALGTLWKWFVDISLKLDEFIQSAWQKIIDFFTQLPSNIWNWLVSVNSKFIEWRNGLITTAVSAGKGFLDSFINWIRQLPSQIWNFLVSAVQKLMAWDRQLREKAIQAGKNLIQGFVDTLKSLPSKMVEIGKNVVQGIWKGISNAGSWLWDKISGFGGGLVDGFCKALGINSPSKVFAMEARWIPAGIAEGISQASGQVYDELNALSDGMVKGFNPTLNASAILGTDGTALGYGSGAVIYNQTINSPKSLDLRELSRQSKNLFAFANM